MQPSESKFPGFNFSIDDKSFFVGLFLSDSANPASPVYPSLLQLSADGIWAEVARHDVITTDVEASTTAEALAPIVIAAFNSALTAILGAPKPSFGEQLSAIFQSKLAVANRQLVIVA